MQDGTDELYGEEIEAVVRLLEFAAHRARECGATVLAEAIENVKELANAQGDRH
ncbi:MAG: hypothetical protein AAF943_10700 [Pseudomonadota bacterium]